MDVFEGEKMAKTRRCTATFNNKGSAEKHLLLLTSAFFYSLGISAPEASKLPCDLPPLFHHLSLKDNPARKIGPPLNCSPKE